MNKEIKVVTLRQHIAKKIKVDDSLSTKEQVIEAFRRIIGNADREHLAVFMLNCVGQVNAVDVCSVGSLTCSVVHPREVFKNAILSNAEKIILVHNHPFGELIPSKADIEITHNLIKASEIMKIPLIDHLIVSEGKSLSFLEEGLMER